MKRVLLHLLMALPVIAFTQNVNWISIHDLEAAQKKDPRPVMIDVYTDWCGWCKRMDQQTFQHKEVAEYINKHFHAVKLDGEEKDSIEFMGQTFKYVASGRRGYNQLPAALLNGKLSYPTVVFLNEKFEMISPVPGFQSVEKFEAILKFIATKQYTDRSWDDYKKNFVSGFNKNHTDYDVVK